MRIHVHLGAHKTATTFMQDVWEMNRPALNAVGIGYMPRAAFRARVSRHLEKLPGNASVADILDGFFEGPPPAEIKGLLISEENLPGTNAASVHTGVMYPLAESRLGLLRNFLRGHDVTGFLCVRAYDGYIASQYCEALNWGPFTRFDQFRARMRFETFRWPSLYTRIGNALRPDCVRLWRYEDFRQNAEAVLRSLAFGYEGPLDMDNKDVNISLSHAAVERLYEIERTQGPDVAKSHVARVEAELPKGPGRPGYDPWTQDEHGRLQAIYDQDCASLPDKWLVRPPHAVPQKPASAAAN